MKGFDHSLAMLSCTQWESSNSKMPMPADLKRKCIELQKWRESKHISPENIGKCEFFDAAESQISRTLCMKVNHADKQASQVNFGKTLCPWHYEIVYAQMFPFSNVTDLVKHLIEFRTKEVKEGRFPYPKNVTQGTENRRSTIGEWVCSALEKKTVKSL